MKKLVLILLFVLVQISFGQWEECNNGLNGGTIYEIANCGNYLFAVALNDLYTSSDNGENWQKNNLGLAASTQVNQIVVYGNEVYACTRDGLYLTADYGKNWIELNLPKNGESVYNIKINGIKRYIIVSDGLCVSTDNGATWNLKNMSDDFHYINSFALKGDSIILTIRGNIYLSPDAGESWKIIDSVQANQVVYSGNNFYLTNGGQLYITSDIEKSWTPLGPKFSENSPTYLGVFDKYIFIGGFDGLLFSTSSGVTWQKNPSSFGKYEVVNSIAINGNMIFAGTNYDGIYWSTDVGKNWSLRNSGIHKSIVRSLGVTANNIFSCTINGIFKSENNCNSWAVCDSGLNFNNVNSICVNNNDIFLGVENEVFHSTDNGNNWEKIFTGLTDRTILAIVVHDNNLIIGSDGDGIFSSSDWGKTWVAKDSNLRGGMYNYYFIKSLFIKDNNIFAGTNGGIFMSTDNGNYWVEKNSGRPSNPELSVFAVKDGNIFVGGDGEYSSLYVSSDNGNHWRNINPGFNNLWVYAFAVTGEYIFAGTNHGILLSTDNGQNWIKKDSGMENQIAHSLAIIDNGYILAGTNDGGTYKAKIYDLTSVNIESDKYKNNFQIIPNPSSDYIEISGVGPHCNVPLQDIQNNIQIYNIFGEMVLSNPQPLTPEPLKINISALSAGVYYLKIGNEVKMFIKE